MKLDLHFRLLSCWIGWLVAENDHLLLYEWSSGMAVAVCFRLLLSGLFAGPLKIATGYGSRTA